MKINLKVHDIINCLNKNSMTHFVWYLKKAKKYDIQTLSIESIRKITFLWKNHTENVQQKLVPDLFIIFVNNPKQPLHVRNYFKGKIFERGLSKSLKKVTSFFLLNLVPFKRQSYQKQKGPGTSVQSLFRLWNQFRNISLSVIHYLTKFDDVI